MKTRNVGPTLAVALLTLLSILSACADGGLEPPKTAKKVSIAGAWYGTLGFGAQRFRLVFHLTPAPDGQGLYTCTMDSLDQHTLGIPADHVAVNDADVVITFLKLKGEFRGRLYTDGIHFEGIWTQAGVQAHLSLVHVDKAPTLDDRPQTPMPPYPYQVEDVRFPSYGGIEIAGTLTIPTRIPAPAPAVLLISGSGPNDRDEDILGHKVLHVLADYLTREGLIVLRYDKRGVGKSEGDYAAATTLDFTDDALAGVYYLTTRKEVDKRRIGLIGHSEGGLIAPLAATKSKDVHYIVLMAGPGLTGDALLERQSELILRANGATDKAVADALAGQKRLFAILRSHRTPEQIRAELDSLGDEQIAKMPPELKHAGGGDEAVHAATQAQLAMALSPWYRFFLDYDPIPVLQRVRCPVLAINGANDLQVPAHDDLPAIGAALKDGGNSDYTVKELPHLNHLFQTCKTGSPSEYGEIKETISPVALDTISDWIHAHTIPSTRAPTEAVTSSSMRKSAGKSSQ